MEFRRKVQDFTNVRPLTLFQKYSISYKDGIVRKVY
jgi:hypothetical protein